MEKFSSEFQKLGVLLKERRIEQGISQQTLSAICDVDIRTVQRIEKGDSNFSLIIFFSICEALQLDISKVFYEINR